MEFKQNASVHPVDGKDVECSPPSEVSMTQSSRITVSKHIQVESLLNLAMLTPAEFEELIRRLSHQGMLDDIVVSDDATNEKAIQPVAKEMRGT